MNLLDCFTSGLGIPAAGTAGRDRAGAIGGVCASGCAVWVEDLPAGFPHPAWSFLATAGLRGAMLFPVRHRTDIIGAIALFSRHPHRPDDFFFELTADLGGQIGQLVERMRTERALRQAKESFRGLFDEAPLPYHEIDRLGRITRVNRAECDLLGYSPAEIVGRPAWEFVDPGEREESRRNLFAKLARQRPIAPSQRVFRGRDGAVRCVELYERLITDDQDRVLGIRTAMIDITASRRTRQQIARQALLLEHATDVIFALDTDFCITYLNRAAEQTYGLDRATALGRPFSSVVRSEMAAEERARIRQDLLAKGWWQGEIDYLDGPGRTVAMEISCSVHYDDVRSPQGIIVIQRDLTERRRAEAALHSSEERLKFAQRAAGIGLWDLDLKNNRAQYSDQAYALYGIQPGASPADAHAWELLVHPDDRERLLRDRDRLLATGGDFSNEYRIFWPDGSVRWLSTKGSAILDANGRAERLTGAVFDITEQKLADERIRMLSLAVEQSPISIVITDLKGHIVYANPKVCQATGYTLEELKGQNPRLLKSGETPPEVYAAMWRQIQVGEWHGVFHNRRKNGELFWEAATIAPIRGADGAPTHYLAVKEDITERKKMEEALQHSKQLNAELAAIVESSDAAIVSKDFNGNVLTWNPGAQRLYGYAAEEMIGRNVSILMPPGLAAEEADIAASLRGGKRIDHLETVRTRKDGSAIEVLLSISPVRDPAGNVVGASQIAWDITERKLLARQLSQAQKLESIGQLAAGIAHEINTPIQYIGDNAKFLEDAFLDLFRVIEARRPPLASKSEVDLDYLRVETPKAIQQMLEGVEQVARIVRAMKEFSHPGPVGKTLIDVNRAIESTIAVSRNEWKYAADLHTDFDRQLPPVPCVAGEINQVILNLVVNAAHAIADVVKDTSGKGRITISTRGDGDWVEIRVTDTGGGIPEAIRGKIFDPFFTTKEVGKGTGQGLAIAHTVIVRNHGGSIRFVTEVGAGTTFLVRLPLHQEASA